MKWPSHQFVPINESLLEVTRRWRNTARIQQQVRAVGHVTREAQQQWYERLKHDDTQRYFVLYQQDEPIGTLAFTQIDLSQHEAEWGGYIGAERYWPGTGLVLEAAALDYAFVHLRLTRLYAEVFEDNLGPQRTHKLFGYTEHGAIARANDRNLIQFSHQRDQWLTMRPQVMRRLPDKIVGAINDTTFSTYLTNNQTAKHDN